MPDKSTRSFNVSMLGTNLQTDGFTDISVPGEGVETSEVETKLMTQLQESS